MTAIRKVLVFVSNKTIESEQQIVGSKPEQALPEDYNVVSTDVTQGKTKALFIR